MFLGMSNTEERVKRGFPAFWRTVLRGPTLLSIVMSGQLVKCPPCYPDPVKTRGRPPHKCPWANPLVLVDPVTNMATGPQQQKKGPPSTTTQNTNTHPGIYTDCLLCETLFLVPLGTKQADPGAYTCPKCLSDLAESSCGRASTSSAPSSSSSARPQKRQKKNLSPPLLVCL